MVDLETTGLDPSHHAIIQIAAVRFNFNTGSIGPMFDMCLDVPPTRYWDQGTLEWWQRQPEVLDRILAASLPARDVWNSFVNWCISTAPALGDGRLWAKPIHFEWPLLQSYGREFEREMPFHYRNAVDVNSFTRGMARNPGAEPIKIPFDGDEHYALDDVLHQIGMVLSAKVLIP